MELLQWHKVCEIGGEELHRPPVVALPELVVTGKYSPVNCRAFIPELLSLGGIIVLNNHANEDLIK